MRSPLLPPSGHQKENAEEAVQNLPGASKLKKKDKNLVDLVIRKKEWLWRTVHSGKQDLRPYVLQGTKRNNYDDDDDVNNVKTT